MNVVFSTEELLCFLVFCARARHKHPRIHVSARHARTRTHTHTRTADLFVCNGRSFARIFFCFFFYSLNTSTASFFVKIGFLTRFYLAWPMAVACSFILADRLRSLTLYNALAQRSRIFVSYLFIYLFIFFISLISLFIISWRRINDSRVSRHYKALFFLAIRLRKFSCIYE